MIQTICSNLFLVCGVCFFLQEQPNHAANIQVEIPLRVVRAGTFVSNLDIDDFRLYEDDQIQKIDALYLIKGNQIKRKDEQHRFRPDTKRNFYLFFVISEYSKTLDGAIVGFVQHVLKPKDSLTIITPFRTFRMKNNSHLNLPNEEFIRQLREIIKKDALRANSEYSNIFTEANQAAEFLSELAVPFEDIEMMHPSARLSLVSPADFIVRYSSLLQMLAEIRKVNEERILSLARNERQVMGRKHFILFYQREWFRPIDPSLLIRFERIHNDNPGISYSLAYLENSLQRDMSFNSEKILQTFSDLNVSIHFRFLPSPYELSGRFSLKNENEISLENYKKIAWATGGTIENIKSTGDNTFEIFDDYYLLYYTPLVSMPKTNFRNIKITIDRQDLRVFHRSGYFEKQSR